MSNENNLKTLYLLELNFPEGKFFRNPALETPEKALESARSLRQKGLDCKVYTYTYSTSVTKYNSPSQKEVSLDDLEKVVNNVQELSRT